MSALRIPGYLDELPHDYLIGEHDAGWRLECSCGTRSRFKDDRASASLAAKRHAADVARVVRRRRS